MSINGYGNEERFYLSQLYDGSTNRVEAFPRQEHVLGIASEIRSSIYLNIGVIIRKKCEITGCDVHPSYGDAGELLPRVRCLRFDYCIFMADDVRGSAGLCSIRIFFSLVCFLRVK